MSEKHLPKYRRSNAKEGDTARRVIEYLKQQNAIYPSANIHVGDLAGVIGLGMGTVKESEIVPRQRFTDEERADFKDLIDG